MAAEERKTARSASTLANQLRTLSPHHRGGSAQLNLPTTWHHLPALHRGHMRLQQKPARQWPNTLAIRGPSANIQPDPRYATWLAPTPSSSSACRTSTTFSLKEGDLSIRQPNPAQGPTQSESASSTSERLQASPSPGSPPSFSPDQGFPSEPSRHQTKVDHNVLVKDPPVFSSFFVSSFSHILRQAFFPLN